MSETEDMSGMDFDNGEYGPELTPEEQETVGIPPSGAELLAQQLLNQHLAPDNKEDEISMQDVDKRLEIASYFREVLKSKLFGDSTPAATYVEKKIRSFVREQLETLVGISSTPKEVIKLPFNEQEIKTLKILANLSDLEIKSIKILLEKVMVMPVVKSNPEPPTLTQIKPPEPKIKQISSPKTASAPVTPEPPKRKPGRPPAPAKVEEKIDVVDPVTGKERKLKKIKTVTNPNATPFPSGDALAIVSAMKAEAQVGLQGNGPVLQQMILGAK